MIKQYLVILILSGLAGLVPLTAGAATSVETDDIEFTDIGRREYDAGEAQLRLVPVWWESDSAWSVAVEVLDPNLGVSYDGRYTKSVTDLQFRLSGDQTWTLLRNYPQVITGSHQTGRGSFKLDWRVLLDWLADRPGDYHAELRFTISNP